MQLRPLDPPDAPPPLARYAQSFAVTLPGGSLVFLAGQVGIDRDGKTGSDT